MKKRIFAALLVFIMTLSLLPSNALAVDVPAEYRPTIEWTKDLAMRDHSLTVEVVHEGNSLGTTSSTAKHLSATVKLSNDSIEVYDSEATGGSYSRSTFKLFTFAGTETEGHLKLYTRSTAGHKVTVNYVFNDESGRTKASVEKQVKYHDKETFALAEDHYNCTIRVTSGDAKAEKDTLGRLAVTGGTQDSVVTVTYTPKNNCIYIDKYFDNGGIFSKWDGENIRLNGYEFVENNKLTEKSVIAGSDLTPAMEDYRFLTVTNKDGSTTVYDFSYAVMIPKPFDETNMKLTDVWYDRNEGKWYFSHLNRKGLSFELVNEGGVNFCYNTVHSESSYHHQFQLVETVAPTCTAGGYSLYRCAYCTKTEQRDQTAALNHNWGSWTHDAATTGAESTHTRTCKRDASHTETRSCNFIENDGTYTCSECGYSYGTYTLTYEWSGLPDGTTDPALPAAVNNLSNGEYTLADGFSSSSTATVNGTKYQFSGWKIKETDTAVNGTVTIAGASIILTGTWTPKDPGTVTIKLSDYIKKDLTVTGSGFQGETFTVTVRGASESGGGKLTGKVTYAAGDRGVKAFTVWEVVEEPTGGNYEFNGGKITFKKATTGLAYSFSVDEVEGGTEGMGYDGSSHNFNVWVGTNKESGKLEITETSKAIKLENHYNGTVSVPLGQYIKKVYRSECGCTPETTFQFEALIKESVPEVNALSPIEAAPVEKKVKTYTATGSVTLKAGTEQVVDMSIDLPEGFYEVTLKEVNDKTANVSYDKTVYTFGISVFEYDGNVRIGFSDVKKNGKEHNEQVFVFTNSYMDRHFIPVTPTPSKPALNTGDHFAYVMGYPDGTVRPNGSITRAEVSTILFRLLSDKTRDEYFTTESSFTDVKAGAWYNNSIATLEKAGVIVDTAKGGAFRPDEAITRAELAAMLAQFADAKSVTGVKFTDVSADHWAYDAIAIAAKMGWIAGYPDGTFRPDATITRAEMMTLVNRALERVPSEEDHLLSERVMLTFPDCKSGDWFYIAVQEATNSHTYERAVTEKNGDEQWTALRANRDWTLLEK